MSDWAWTQAGQVGQIATILGADKVLLEGFTASERISELFTITVQVVSTDPNIDFTPHLGTGVGLAIDGNPDTARFFHGVLFEATRTQIEGGSTRYELLLRPWLSLLDLGRGFRIYQDMSVKDIVDDVIKRAGFTDYSINLSSCGLAKREYCVQYRESDFSFISRLMEEEGIYYYFAHSENSHKMLICDDISTHASFDPVAEVYHSDKADSTDPHLWVWGPVVRQALNKVSLRDVNFQRATEVLLAEADASSEGPTDKAEFYDFPGGFGEFADDGSLVGTPYAKSQLDASRGLRNLRHGLGDVFAIPVGAWVSVKDGVTPESVFVLAANHRFGVQSYIAEQITPVQAEIDFEAIPKGGTWRPARKTPKPVAPGPQSATVVGAPGQVIEVDKYGRIHVQFPWDRVGTMDNNSSCWIRVSQSSADGGFGHMHIPRIGEEVIVDFLDGDPDRPIVTGRVYNSARMPPYTLPDEKTKSTWKSQTVGSSGSYDGAENPPSGTGFNEIRFEDKGGSEEVFIHAQRVMNSWYRLDETRKTGRDTAIRVGRNRQTNIQKNETLTVETGDETRNIQQGSRQTTIQKADTLTLNTGDYSMKVSAGQATFEAMQQITLKVGSNSIVISQQGVTIKALTVSVTADTTLAVKGLTSDLEASTMMTIKGAMVMIN